MTADLSPRPTIRPDQQRSDTIDGLRAVAAVAVFVFHSTWRAPFLHDLQAVTGHLDTGVEIFFVLSGFLIFTPFARAIAARRAAPALGSYVARRAARIWPAYLVAVVGIVVLGEAHFDGVGGAAKHLSLTYLYFDDQGGDGLAVAWTLVVEASFYAFVPVAAFVLARTRAPLVGATVALVALGAVAQRHVAFTHDDTLWIRILPPALLTLGLGMVLAAVRAEGDGTGRLGRALHRLAARPALPLAGALVAYLVLVRLVPPGTDIWRRPGDRVVKELLQAVVALGLALPVLLRSVAGRWDRFLGHRTMAYLGTISYGFYLWHIPVLRWFRDLLLHDHVGIAVLGWCLAFGCTLLLAAASWHLVERPVIRAVGRRRASRQPSTVP